MFKNPEGHNLVHSIVISTWTYLCINVIHLQSGPYEVNIIIKMQA
jgi:hypothetical protein